MGTAYLTTPTKTPSGTVAARSGKNQNVVSTAAATATTISRFEAYNRLQAAAVAFGEKLPIPEIVAVGGQSDGKSSLLEALLGFRFNVREVEMGTRRPLILQMVHDPTALEPRCRFQEEDSEEYGSSVVLPTAIADIIRARTELLLRKTKAAVSPKLIVMRAEYAHCPNLTIIDTPGFVLKAKKGEPESTPEEILSMVKSLASPPHRILLFLQQSSVEWCSSLWLDAVREIDPAFKRTIVVASKFDNRLKEFNDRREVDGYLSASGYLGEHTHPFFVALPKDRNTVSNEEFRRQISLVDSEVLRHLRENVKGGFDDQKFGAYIGFGRLKDYLESELQKRYKEAAPATLALLEQRCNEVAEEVALMDSKIQSSSDVACLRRFAMLHAASVSNHVSALINGAADPAPEHWGMTTDEECSVSGIGGWPGVAAYITPPNASLKLFGGAAFERVIHEFRCAAYSIESPPVSREKVANILLAHAGRWRRGRTTEAVAEIARAAARSWLAPLLDTACDRLAFVLGKLYDIASERIRICHPEYEKQNGSLNGSVGFHASLRQSYNAFVKDLSRQCKQLVRHHLDSVTSPYSLVCYENGHSSVPHSKMNQNSFSFDLLDGGGRASDGETIRNTESIPFPPEKNAQHATPGKITEASRERECQLTVPETPSPDQPFDGCVGGMVSKENGNCAESGPRKRTSRMTEIIRNDERLREANCGSRLFSNNDDADSRSGSDYLSICSTAAHHFARIREVLVEQSVPSTLNSGFLTPCQNRLLVAVGLDLFAVSDDRFMDMFVAPNTIDALQNQRHSLHKRQKILQSCLNEFKSVALTL